MWKRIDEITNTALLCGLVLLLMLGNEPGWWPVLAALWLIFHLVFLRRRA